VVHWPRGLAGAALGLSLATACGAGIHGRADALPGLTTPGTPSTVFVASDIDLPVAAVEPQQAPSYIRAVATIYQPSTARDDMTAPFLAAMFAPGEDCCLGFPGIRGPHVEEGFRSLHIQGRAGAVGRVGDGELVVWTTPPTSQESDEAAVLGDGVSDAQLRRAAAGTRASQDSASIVASALPAGYRPVARGPMNVDRSALGGGFMVRYGNNSSYLQVETASGGPALLALARATTGGRSVDIAGRTVWSGPALVDGAQIQRYIWRDGDEVVAVDAEGLPAEQVQHALASLRREPRAQAEHELRRQIGRYPVQQLARAGEQIAVSMRLDGGVIAVKLDSGTADKLLLEVAGVGLPPEILGIETGWSAQENRATWTSLDDGRSLVFGSTRLEASSVRLTGPSGRRFEATLGHAPGRGDLTFFAAVVPQNGEPPSYTISARDGHGRVLATWGVN